MIQNEHPIRNTRMRAIITRIWNSPILMTWSSLSARLLSVTLTLPLVLVRFSPEQVAVWQLFATFITLQMMFDFGMAPTFSRLIAYAYGGASVDDMRRIDSTPGSGCVKNASSMTLVMSSQRWLYIRISLVITLLFALVGTKLLIRPIGQLANEDVGWNAWVVVLVSSAFCLWGNGYAAALQGIDKIALVRRWEMMFSVGQTASAVTSILLGGGLFWLVLSNQAWLIAGAFRNRKLMQMAEPETFAVRPSPDPRVLKVLWPAAWRSGIGILMSQGIIQASGLIYSQYAAATQVSTYLLALRIMNLVSQFSQAPFYSCIPKLAALQATGDRGALLEMASRGMRFAHWIFCFGVLLVAVSGKALLDMIGSQTKFVDLDFWLLMSFAFWVERYGAMHMQLYSTTNRIVWHVVNGVTGVIILTFGWSLSPGLGIWAMPVSMLIGYIGFYSWYSAKLSAQTFSFSWFQWEKSASLTPFVFLIVSAALLHFVAG